MSIPGVSWVIIVIGIIICFAGIWFKKIFEAILGFIWGALSGYLILIFLALAGNDDVKNMDDVAIIVVLIVMGLVLATLSVVLERVMMAIRGFLISFLIVLAALDAVSFEMEERVALIVAIVIALIVAWATWVYHKYAFIFECAITGSIMINHIGLMGGLNPSDYTANLLYGSSRNIDNSTSIILTVLVAIAGIVVQSMILKKIENGEIGLFRAVGDNKRTSGSGISITSLLQDSHIKKASFSAIRDYEKYLVIAPLISFFFLTLLHRYAAILLPVNIANLYFQTWRIWHYLDLICKGIFEGALIYFVIYYEVKASAIYQLFALSWLVFEIWDYLRIHVSIFWGGNPRYNAVSIGNYALIWGLLLLVDCLLKNEIAKLIAMCMATIFMISAGYDLLMYGNLYFFVDLYCFVHWTVLVITVVVLVYLRKNKKDKKCLKCGELLIEGDTFCRNCGEDMTTYLP